ncbi:MAG: DNA repair protein RecO [Proteobacteria bacterium]|nr:MAG: DNA repair protein RecO [Pseudomonadota bacterium]
MAQLTEDMAIVLRASPFKERDKLVTFLTENHGRITGVARNSIHSKRFGGTLDLFACSKISYKEGSGELVWLDEANLRRDFLKIREKLENISAAGYFVDLCLRLTEENHPVREVFMLLAHYLYLLEEHTATFEIVRSFEIKLLERLGWAPVLDECVSCTAPFFGEELSPEESFVTLATEQGGFLCHNCATPNARHIPLASLLWMIQARETMIQHTHTLHFPLDPMMEAAGTLQYFLRWHAPGLGKYRFRSHGMLEQFLLEAREDARELLASGAIGSMLGDPESFGEMPEMPPSGPDHGPDMRAPF